MKISEYIILGISIILTISWCLKIRKKTIYEQNREKSMEFQGFLMTVSIVGILLFKFSSFHLIWLLPLSFVLGLLSAVTPLKLLYFLSSLYFKVWFVGANNLGRKYYVDGDYHKAINEFENVVTKNPKSEGTFFNLGLAYEKINNFPKAIEAYEKAINLNPKRPELFFNIGIALKNNNNKKRAIIELKKAVKLRDNYVKAHYGISLLYAETGDFKKAFYELEIVDKLSKNLSQKLSQEIKKLEEK